MSMKAAAELYEEILKEVLRVVDFGEM